MALAGNRAVQPSLIYGSAERQVRKDVRVFGWRETDQTLAGE